MASKDSKSDTKHDSSQADPTIQTDDSVRNAFASINKSRADEKGASGTLYTGKYNPQQEAPPITDRIAFDQYIQKQQYFKKLAAEKNDRKDSARKIKPGSNKSKLALLANTIAGALNCTLEDVWTDADYNADNTTSVSANILMHLGDVESNLDTAWKKYITSTYASLISDAFVWIETNCMKRHMVPKCTMSLIISLDDSGQTLFGNLCRTFWNDRAQKGNKSWTRLKGWQSVQDEFKQLQLSMAPYFDV